MRYHDALKQESMAVLSKYYIEGRHTRSCASHRTSPVIGKDGFCYDVAVINPCDCFLSEPIPETHRARTSILRKLRADGFITHGHLCASYFLEPIQYRGESVMMRLACNCWISVPVPE